MSSDSGAGTGENREMLAAIEADLRSSLDLADEWLEAGIVEMIAYHLGWSSPEQPSGKRIRPLLTLLCCQASGGEWHSALPAAGAIEWIHNFSLIHDDIQDRSELRRGRPTVWKIWGDAQAINTGDAIFALARWSTQRLVENGSAPDKVLEIHRLLDETSLSLTSGQHLDISFESSENVTTNAYLRMIKGKTGALLAAACELGARLSTATDRQIKAYRNFGENLGLAFQVIDDLLGIWGASTTTGKSSADDLQTRKKTLPIIHGLTHSQEFRELWNSEVQPEQDLARLKSLLDQSGSKQFTTEWASHYTSEALASLRAAEPSEPAGSSLSSLAARLLQRVA